MGEEVSKLYKALISKGYSTDDLGNEKVFAEKMSDKANRKQLYDWVSSKGDFRIGDYDTYEKRLQPTTTPSPVGEGAGAAVVNNGVPEYTGELLGATATPTASDKPMTAAQRAQGIADLQEMVGKTRDMGRQFAENAERMLERNTEQGRKRRDTAETMARMVGTSTSLVGVRTTTPQQAAEGAAATENKAPLSTTSPQPYSVVYEDGQPKTQWLMPDGSLTTDYMQAEQGEYDAREGRRAKGLHDRMKANGLDPENELDVQKQVAQEEIARLERMYDEVQQQGYDALAETRKLPKSEMRDAVEHLNDNQIANNPELGRISEAIKVRKEQLERLETVQNKRDGKYEGALGKTREAFAGVYDNAGWKTLDFFGAGDMRQADMLLGIKAKIDRGEELSETDTALAKSLIAKQGIDELVDKELGLAYSSGGIGIEAVPFVTSIFVTGGYSGVAKGIAKGATKAAVKASGKAVTMALRRSLPYKIVKATGIAAGDIIASALISNTAQAGKTYANVLNRYTGSFAEDENGDIKLGHYEEDENGNARFVEGGDNWYTALYKGEASSIIENYTEKLGDHLHLGKRAIKAMSKVGLGGVSRFFSQIGEKEGYKTVNAWLKRLGIHGFVPEVVEEEINIPLNAAFVGDQQFSDILDRKTQLEIICGMLFSVGGMGIMASGAYGAGKGYNYAQFKRYESKLDNADRVASFRLTEDVWRGYRDRIDNATNDEFSGVLADIAQDSVLSEQEKLAIADYAKNLIIYRGFNAASTKRAETQTEEERQDEGETNRAYAEGYELTEAADMNQARNMYDYRREQLAQLLGVSYDTLNDFFGDNPLEVVRGMRGTHSEEHVNIAMAYLNAKAAYDGMQDRIQNTINSEVERAEREIDDRTNKTTGTVQEGTLKVGDKKVHILSGNVVMFADGTAIDSASSDESIIVRNAETGEVRMISPDALLNVGEAVDAESEKQRVRDELSEQIAQQENDKIEGKQQQPLPSSPVGEETAPLNPPSKGEVQSADTAEPIDVGSVVQLNNADGTATEATVVEMNEDGIVLETAEGEVQMSADELERRLQPLPTSPNGEETALNGTTESAVATEQTATTEPAVTAEPQAERAIDRIPAHEEADGKGGVRTVRDWEQAESGDTYDALQEMYGDEALTDKKIGNRIASIDRQIKDLEKQQSKLDNSDDFDADFENIDAYRQIAEQKKALEQSKAYWEGVRNTPKARAEAQQIAEQEARAEAERVKSEEERKKNEERIKNEELRRENEERAKRERELIEGVPDVTNDTAEDARSRGYRNVNGVVVERQGEVQGVEGREASVKFSDKDTVSGRVKVIEAEQLQPSHIGGQRNASFFIDEAQPKDRTDEVSRKRAREIAENLNPAEITGDGNAYIASAPVVNSRGEVIQGNNRSDALREMWSGDYAQSQEAYKQYLIDHAEAFGLDPEAISAMAHPVMVNAVDVSDEEAIRLGQLTARNLESGGIERIDPVTTSRTLGGRMSNFASVLLTSTNEDASISELLSENGAKALRWLESVGAITPTQVRSAVDKDGNLTAEAKLDLQNILKQALFQGGVSDLPKMFDALPAKSQKAILTTFMRDFESAEENRILGEIQSAVEVWYNAMNAMPEFAEAKNYESAKRAMELYKRQTNMFDGTVPMDNYSNFAFELAVRMQGHTMKSQQTAYNDFYDLVQGKGNGDLFGTSEAGEQVSLDEAIQRVYNITNNNNNGKERSNTLGNNAPEGEQGRHGSPADSSGGERGAQAERTADGGAGVAGDSAAGRRQLATEGQTDLAQAEEVGYKLSEEIDNYGKPFVLAGDGTTTFGEIVAESGLTEAPIRLSLGTNKTDESGANHGYGLLHIEASHGDQIRNAGFKSIEDFVEQVAKSYTDIREGHVVAGNQTYLLEVSDEHNNTLFVQLSPDGKYWNVNSAGIFKKKYSRRKPKVFTVPAVGLDTNTDAEGVNRSQTEGETATSRNSPETSSAGKVTESSVNEQGKGEENSAIAPAEGAMPDKADKANVAQANETAAPNGRGANETAEVERKMLESIQKMVEARLAEVKKGGAPLQMQVQGDRTLIGVHNISEEKLRKALRLGGLANPSAAVIDVETGSHTGFGEISLIMPSDLVGKRSGRNAGTWAADAYTPRFPTTERKMSGSGADKLSNDISSLPEDMQGEVRMGMDSYLDGRPARNLAYMFLHEREEAPDLQSISSAYPLEVQAAVSELFGGKISAWSSYYDLSEADRAKAEALYINQQYGGNRSEYEQHISDVISRTEEKLAETKNPKGLLARKMSERLADLKATGKDTPAIDSFIRQVVDDKINGGKTDVNATVTASIDYIKAQGLETEYERWKESLADRYGIEEKLFDGYTPSGKRRYLDATLANISKVMKKKGKAGTEGHFGMGSTRALVAPVYKTLAEIRKNKGRLVSKEEFEKVKGELEAEFSSLAELFRLPTDSDFSLSPGIILEEAIANGDVMAVARKYGVSLSKEDAERINAFGVALRDMPTEYFETKFERPVTLDEFAVAVVPDNVSADIRDALEKQGLQIVEYPHGNESARTEAVRQASDRADIRFQIEADIEAVNERFNERLRELEADPTQKDRVLCLGRAGDVLRSAGVADAEIEMEYDRFVRKSSEGYENQHPFTADDIQDLPKAINAPIAVFDSTTRGDKVILTELEKDGKNFVVAIRAKKQNRKGGVVLEVNEITTLYPKNAKGIVNWINTGKGTMYDKEKTLRWVEALRPHVGTTITNEEFDSAAKIIQNFENPKLSGKENSQGDVRRGVSAPTAQQRALGEVAVELLRGAGIEVVMDEQAMADVLEASERLQEMTVYHGSGALFEAFDHSHMGEGEGAQAYGWGTYVTEVNGIARTYAESYQARDSVSGTYKGLPFAGNPSAESDTERRVAHMIADGMRQGESFSSIVNRMERAAERNIDFGGAMAENARANLAALAQISEQDFKVENSPRIIYTVEIPEDTGKNYLGWETVYGDEQSEDFADKAFLSSRIERGLQAIGADESVRERIENELERLEFYDEDTMVSGEEIYNVIEQAFGSDKQASEFLAKAGFVGIKYPAQYQNGGREDGAKNYVIFNEADAKITSREQFLRTARGEVYGFVKDGKVYLDPKLLNPNTPIHEYTHLWDTALQRNNPELWKRGVELMKQTALWEQIKNDPAYKDIADNDDLLASEVHARLTGAEGASILREELRGKSEESLLDRANRISLVENLKQWIADAWQWVRDTMTPWTREEAQGVTLDEFVRMPIADLVDGKRITEGVALDGSTQLNAKNRGNAERREQRDNINGAIDNAVSMVTGKTVAEAREERMVREQERRDRAKEMYENVLRGEFNDVTLQQIDEYIDEFTPNNPYGRHISERLPQKVERRLHGRNRANAVDALFSRISEGAVEATRGSVESKRRGAKAKKKELLKGWAQATGRWYTDVADLTDGAEPIGRGKDSVVYNSKDGKHVIKLSKGKDSGKFVSDIDAVALYNGMFPSTAYNIIGYGEIGGEFVTILEQPRISFAENSVVSEEERVDYMRSIGFEPLRKSNTIFTNGEVVVADVQKGNIVRSPEGRIYVIDADVKLHTKDLGGTYTYPPTAADVEDRRQSEPLQMQVEEGDTDIRYRQGSGAVGDTALSRANDPMAKMGVERTAKQQREFAARERRRMAERAQELSEKLGVPVEVRETTDGLTGAYARAKGWYDVQSGKVVIVVPNHTSMADIEKTMLHEIVAHKGLRELFGEQFDTFLDNVFASAELPIRKQIVELARRNGWNVRTATEEYLASLAENTDFDAVENSPYVGWWSRIKEAFLRMLHSIGFENYDGPTLTDNELRYVLWRSYQNLVEPGRFRSILGRAHDVAMQSKLGVGNYSPTPALPSKGGSVAAESEAVNERYNERLRELEADPTQKDRVLRLGRAGDVLRSAGVADAEIEMEYDRFVRKSSEEYESQHPFTADEIQDLPKAINAPIAVFDSTNGRDKVILTELQKDGNNFIVAIKAVQRNRKGGVKLVVNEIATLFPKEAKGIVNWINTSKGAMYDKEKTLHWLEALQTHPETELTNEELSSAAKIIQNFENPKVGEGKVLFRAGNNGSAGTTGNGTNRGSLGDTIRSLGDSVRGAMSGEWSARVEAIKAIGGNLQKLRSAMRVQKEYDASTIGAMTDLARTLLDANLLDNLSAHQTKRILSAIEGSLGKKDIAKNVQWLFDIMIDNQLRQGAKVLDKLLSLKGTHVNSSGVEVQGELDPQGQLIAKSVRKYMGYTREDIDNAISELEDKVSDGDPITADNAAIELRGARIAKQYIEQIADSKAEEKALRASIAQARDDKEAGRLTAEQFREYEKSVKDAIRQSKIDRADAYSAIASSLGSIFGESAERAKAWREAEQERINEIRHNINSDMQGRITSEHGEKKGLLAALANNSVVRFFLSPLATFDQMLRMFGSKNVNGEGYLWNRFMRGWVSATENEYTGYRDAVKALDAKVSEMFGKNMTWGKLIGQAGKGEKMTVEFWDGGEMREHELSQGNMLYIYMADKMADGQMKLRYMGITEEMVEQIADRIDPRYKELGDWLQEEYLPSLRAKYNATHERMFGAPMAAIDNYFPLRVLKNSLDREEDVAQDNGEGALASTITGSVIKRKRNNKPLDVTGADAFSVILDHIQEMEHWNAFAELTRDINTMLSYKRFRNQVQNMTTAYGSGKKLWDNFRKTCQMAVGAYRPPVAELDKALVNIAKGVTAAKVSFRVFTALKQILSAPAYLPDANALYLAQNFANPFGAWKWTMENLPLAHKRWNSRMAGDPRLMKSDADWQLWRSKVMELASKWGMSPNAFVDAVTVSIGAHAIYQTKLAKYKKMGFADDVAEEKAKQDATIMYNSTQQSSESAFLSTMQVDRSWLNVLFSVFRNSSMSYTRQAFDAWRNEVKLFTPGYRERSLEFMKKQLVREGLTEEQAEKAARSELRGGYLHNLARLAVFGFGIQAAWNLGKYLPYLLLGDDDDEKDEMLTDAVRNGVFGSIEGLTGGDVISSAGNMFLGAEFNTRGLEKNMPIASDAMTMLTNMKNDRVQALNDCVNILGQTLTGVNPQSLTDAVVAVVDFCGDDAQTARECSLLIGRIMNAPQSQLDKLYFDELGVDGVTASKMSPDEIAARYARYKRMRQTPFTGWMYSDEDKERIDDKKRKKALTTAKDALVKATDGRQSHKELEAWRKEAEATGEALKRIKKLREADDERADEEEYALLDSHEYDRYLIIDSYKKEIADITKDWLSAESADERKELADIMAEMKQGMYEELKAAE